MTRDHIELDEIFRACTQEQSILLLFFFAVALHPSHELSCAIHQHNALLPGTHVGSILFVFKTELVTDIHMAEVCDGKKGLSNQ